MTERTIKQCIYCNAVLAEDGEYHNIGVTRPIASVIVGSDKLQKIRVSHGLCSACYESRVGQAEEAAPAYATFERRADSARPVDIR